MRVFLCLYPLIHSSKAHLRRLSAVSTWLQWCPGVPTCSPNAWWDASVVRLAELDDLRSLWRSLSRCGSAKRIWEAFESLKEPECLWYCQLSVRLWHERLLVAAKMKKHDRLVFYSVDAVCCPLLIWLQPQHTSVRTQVNHYCPHETRETLDTNKSFLSEYCKSDSRRQYLLYISEIFL